MVLLLLVGFVIAAALRWREGGGLAQPDRLSCLCLALLICWCLVASAWSFEPLDAVLRALRTGLVMLIGLLFVCLAWETPRDDARRALRWLCLGTLVALAIVAEELIFGHPLFIAVKGNAANAYLEASRLNRGASALSMLSWLAAAGLILQGRKGIAVAGLLATGAVLFCLESSAAMLAFAAAVVILLLGFLSPGAARLLLLFSVAVPLFGSPVVAKVMNHAGMSETRGLQTTARERVYMWNFTAERISEKPLLGWGFNASRDMPNQGIAPFDPSRGKHKKNKRAAAPPHSHVIAHHPHNAGLQILLELGLVGAVLAAALLWAFLRGLDRLPAASLPWARASVLATLAVAGTAYGIWQNQWLATIAANTAMVALLGAAARPPTDPPSTTADP